MTETTYKSFAVLGAGTVATPLIKELLTHNASVLVVTRPSARARVLPVGAKHAAIDYADIDALATAFRENNVEVIVSTINHDNLEAQPPTAEAAKKANVKLYVPSEYGLPTAGHTEGLLGVKNRFAESLVAADLPFARLYVGNFADWIPYLFALSETGKLNIVGEGTTRGSFTAVSDITGFLAYVLTHLQPSQLHNATFRIEGDRKSLMELASLYGDKVPVARISEFPATVENGPLRAWLQSAVNSGIASTGFDAVKGKDDEDLARSSHSLWPGHQWKSAKEVLNL
ncbi:NAD(P)-binding protein [Leucogyrophana mollusca]|uniref:NAD(P)-binding protein n=1 Tax=Leucogyrophana mollusca TaxID=85980 RepID=A0ACB8BDH5_9AGAM|nr:NAD(P)-binding protein [Leucogyrophana mollusca]